jgi:MATE family multidrug resistance protein
MNDVLDSTEDSKLTSNEIHKQEHLTFSIALKNLTKDAFLAIMGLLFIFINETINIIFIGRFDIPDMIAGIGLGTLYINFSGYIFGIGLIGGLDTLCSQAYGAKDLKMVGIYTNIARICILLYVVIVGLPLIIFVRPILESLGQIEAVVDYASKYCISMLPSVLFALQFNVTSRYLQAMDIFKPSMMITFTTFLFHPIWCYIFIYKFNLDVVGAGIAMSITQCVNFISLIVYIEIVKPNEGSHFWFKKEVFNIDIFLFYLKLAVPSAIMFSAECLGFEVLTLMSSFLGDIQLAANVCIFNFLALIFTIPEGLSLSCSTHVGNSIGARNIFNAKIYSKVGLTIGNIIMIFFTILLYIFNKEIAYLYTDNTDIAILVSDIVKIYVLFCLIDTTQHILLGIIKGIGRQMISSIICLVILYPINIPLAYYFAFTCEYGLRGLWYSQLTTISLLTISYVFIILTTDWEHTAEESINNIEEQRKLTEK